MEPSRWLVITHQCGLEGKASSHHIDARLPRLREQGIETFVITSCASLPDTVLGYRRVPCASFSGLRQEIRLMAACRLRNRLARRAVRTLLLPLLPGHLLESALLRLDATWSWFVAAGTMAAACARRCGAGLVYSTSGAPSAHLAGWLCARLCGLPWLAEFQDPVIFGNDQKPGERLYNSIVEKIVAVHADAVVFVTRGAMEQFETRHPLEGRGRVIYPGAEPLPGTQRSDGKNRGVMLIGHFGSLTMGRLPAPLLDGLEHLVRSEPEARKSVRFLQKGLSDRQTRAQLDRFPYPEMLLQEGVSSKQGSLRGMQECDVLALIQHDGPISSATIPSKAYEYMHTGIPILGLTCANPELEALLRDLGHCAVDLRDRETVRSEVRALYGQWRRNGCLRRIQAVSPHTVEHACQLLMAAAAEATVRHHAKGRETGAEVCGS
ncbi:MAG: glycosyltransferase [Armatimonadota bacterium]